MAKGKIPELELVIYRNGKPMKLAPLWHQERQGKNWLFKGQARYDIAIRKGEWINAISNDKSKHFIIKKLGTVDKLSADMKAAVDQRLARLYESAYLDKYSEAWSKAEEHAKRDFDIKMKEKQALGATGQDMDQK